MSGAGDLGREEAAAAAQTPEPKTLIYRGLGEGAWAITYFGLPLVNADVATLDVRE